MLPYVNGCILSVRSCFRVYQQLVTSRADQKASVSASVLDRHTHELVDQLFEHYLAGKCLRDLDHGSDIKPFDGYFDRARWPPRALVRPQPRMELIELTYLPVRPPSEITLPSVS